MRAFTCGSCREQLVFFENTSCLRCGAPLGYLPADGDGAGRLVALQPEPDGTLAAVDDLEPDVRSSGSTTTYRRCANRIVAGCNWLIAVGPGSNGDELCASCQFTRTRPNDSDRDALTAFVKAETAKRRLLFQLSDLSLPVRPRSDDTEHGLAFDLLSSKHGSVVIGHDDGVVTIDLAEGDDAYRERTRNELGEPYRTLLGHLRHEVGHYFWERLVDGSPELGRFRSLFGDERADYDEALARHYDAGAPDGWEERFVSAYATMHPFEDWAETFAHYLHVHDTLQSAGAAGLVVVGPRNSATGRRDARLSAAPDEDALDADGFAAVVAEWLPLTYALNAVSRSMGRDDLYPFVLPPRVIEKLAFVHSIIRSRTRPHGENLLATVR